MRPPQTLLRRKLHITPYLPDEPGILERAYISPIPQHVVPPPTVVVVVVGICDRLRRGGPMEVGDFAVPDVSGAATASIIRVLEAHEA
jgi:hypothetical protein